MNQKGVKGSESKYPCEDPETSKKRGLKQYNDTLHEVSSPPSKIPKVNLGCSRGETSNSDDDSDEEYEGTSDEDGSEDESGYEGTSDKDGSEDESGYETEEEQFEDNLIHENGGHHMNTYKPIRKVRGPTKMKRMWKEYDPDSKIQLKFNRYGQPCGQKTCKLTSFIGYLVRGMEIPLANRNWSKVDKSLKEKLWKTVQAFFHIDESYKPWVLKSASKKWKDFKVVLKRKYFDPELSKRENISNGCADRISAPQWAWPVNHWKSNESQLKSEKNKAARAQQLNGSHTTGSRSNAVVLDQLELKEGRKIGRAELFIATHTRRNGEAIDDYSGEKINEIRKRFQEGPSLIAEETNENDFFSTLFPKERVGRRHGLGLLAGGVASGKIYEALVEVQEVREEKQEALERGTNSYAESN